MDGSRERLFFQLSNCIFNIGSNLLPIGDSAGNEVSEVLGLESSDKNSFENLSDFDGSNFGLGG